MSQFDTRFTKQIPVDSPDETTLSESVNLIFQVSAVRLVYIYLEGLYFVHTSTLKRATDLTLA